jgi:hypothetical protein
MELLSKSHQVPFFDVHESKREAISPSFARRGREDFDGSNVEASSSSSSATSSDKNKPKLRYELNFDHNAPLPQFFEEMTGHWGVKVNLHGQQHSQHPQQQQRFDKFGYAIPNHNNNNKGESSASERGGEGGCCPFCTLPLIENVGRTSRVVIFPCGHAFHQFCMTEDACPTCLYKKFPKLHSFFTTH